MSRRGLIGDIPGLRDGRGQGSGARAMAGLDARFPSQHSSPSGLHPSASDRSVQRSTAPQSGLGNQQLPDTSRIASHAARVSISDNLLRPFEAQDPAFDGAMEPLDAYQQHEPPPMGTCPLGGSQAEGAAFERRKKDKESARKLKSAPWSQNLLTVYDSQTLTSVRGDSDKQSSAPRDSIEGARQKLSTASPEPHVIAQRFFQRSPHPQAQYYSIKEGSAIPHGPQIFGAGYNPQFSPLGSHSQSSAVAQPVRKPDGPRGLVAPFQRETVHTNQPSSPSEALSRDRPNSLFKSAPDQWELEGGLSGEGGSSGSRHTAAHLGSQTWMKVFAPHTSSEEAEGGYLNHTVGYHRTPRDQNSPRYQESAALSLEEHSRALERAYNVLAPQRPDDEEIRDGKEDSAFMRGNGVTAGRRVAQSVDQAMTSTDQLRDSRETSAFLQAKVGGLEEELLHLKESYKNVVEETKEGTRQQYMLEADLRESQAKNDELMALVDELRANMVMAKSNEKSGADEAQEALQAALAEAALHEEAAELARGELDEYKRRMPDELEMARQQARAGVPTQEAELARLRVELDRAYANTMRTREEREEMSAMLDKRSTNHSQLEATIQQLKENIQVLTKESTALRDKLAEAHQLAASRESEHTSQVLELASLKQGLSAREKEISRLMSEKAALRDSFDEELDRLVSESKAHLEDETGELYEEIDRLHRETDALRAAANDLANQLEEARASSADVQGKRSVEPRPLLKSKASLLDSIDLDLSMPSLDSFDLRQRTGEDLILASSHDLIEAHANAGEEVSPKDTERKLIADLQEQLSLASMEIKRLHDIEDVAKEAVRALEEAQSQSSELAPVNHVEHVVYESSPKAEKDESSLTSLNFVETAT